MARVKQIIPEFAIETLILDWLNTLGGCFAWKVETSGYYDSRRGIFRKRRSRHVIKGTADIIGVYRGRLFAMEVKSRTGRVTPEQLQFLERVRLAGGIAGVVKTLEDAHTLLFESMKAPLT